MPIYNGIEFIDQSVMSIINQTYKNWELLIGINGHLKDSEVYMKAKKYETISTKIKVIDFHNIKGKSKTLNEMLKYCNPKYSHVALLDVDDMWHIDKLRQQCQYLDKFDVVGTQCIYFGDINGISPSIPLGIITHFDFKSVNPIINSSVVLRKELCYWDDESGIDGVEDYDLWLRLKRDGKHFFNIKDIYVYHRIHNTSSFNSKGNGNLVNIILKKY